jgi:hypothetical protein
MTNNVFYKPQNKKNVEESSLENWVVREWHPPSSYPNIRILPVQKGTNETGEVKWFTF